MNPELVAVVEFADWGVAAVVVAGFSGLEVVLGVLGVLVVLLGLVIYALTRHRECGYDGEPEGGIVEMLPALAGSTHGTLIGGNAVRLVEDEAYFDVLCDELARAECSVHLETYLWKAGEASERVVGALCEVARRGVPVRVLADAWGTAGVSKQGRNRMMEAGCHMAKYHRWSPKNLGRFNIRDHRKIVLIDGCRALVGGHCITDRWLKDEPDKPRYRDVSALVSGPIVGSIQSAFLDNWHESTGEWFIDRAAFPQLDPCGEISAHLAYVRPDGCPAAVQILHYVAIALAKTSIRIQNPYFLPDRDGAEALVRAARRGVDVQVMTPAISASDSKYVQRAGHNLYGFLLAGGVKMFEYERSLLHQKVITVDGEWCALGSCNFDNRSFEINDEISLCLADRGLAGELERTFQSDLEFCVERKLAEWKKRPWWKRWVDWFHFLFSEQM